MLMAEWVEEPAFLTAEQVRTARDAIRSTSLRLLFDLMVRVGLRSCEARTFPVAYVFDPSTRVDLRPGTLIDVRLNPKEMKIKFNKPRVVHVPYSLMEEMYAYSELERNARLDPRNPRRELILTTCSNPYSRQSLVKVISSISKEVRFPISPLMLRHSYAIHTLLFLRAHPEIQIEPLMYVRDRLGHSSVQTTMTYLRQIERLLGAEALAMMNEFDSLYRIGDGLASVAPQGRKSRENWKVSDGSS
jgi:integrase